MVKGITVTAVKAFEHGGTVIEPGTVLDVRAIDAAVLKRRGVVRLGAHAPKPPEPAPAPKRKRTYKTRMLRAER